MLKQLANFARFGPVDFSIYNLKTSISWAEADNSIDIPYGSFVPHCGHRTPTLVRSHANAAGAKKRLRKTWELSCKCR
jgi:hypothetical protein